MKSIYHLAIALMFAFTVDLNAAVPAGKTEQLTASDEVPEGLETSDWTSIRAAYEAGRHAFQPVGGGWQARNPGQQWTTKFDGRGFTAEPKSGGWQWGLELKSYGFVGHERAISGKPSVKADGQRLSYDWNTAVQEWWVNDTHGLEHGFTVRERPAAGADAMAPLHFDLAVRGTLKPQIAADGLGVEFHDDSGALILSYAGLKVWDADGRVLLARFTPAQASVPDMLRLLVDERDARYPITIDPIAQQAYLKASNTDEGDRFGHSVAVSGDTVVIGALREDSSTTGVNSTPDKSAAASGAAYIFVRSGTVWTQQAYLKASNTGTNDEFGRSVAISGDTVVVGASGEDSSRLGVNSTPNESATNSGAAYIFIRSGTTWTQQAYLKASNTGASDSFGISVAVAGDTVVVGAHGEASAAMGVNGDGNDNSFYDSGAAYIFVRSDTTWTQQAYLKASNTGADSFGWTVAVHGDTAVVGALHEQSSATGINGNGEDNSASSSGAAYVFVRGGTSWTQQAYLKASNTGASDLFGISVAVAGDTVVVGASGEDSSRLGVNSTPNESATNSGAAYIFIRSGTTWTQQAYLKASNTGASDSFGISVAVAGDTVVVGAHGEASNATGVNGNQANNSASAAGAAYVFSRSGATWIQQTYLKATNPDINDRFGSSVAVSDDTVTVGAYDEASSATGVGGDQANNSSTWSGAAYIFSPGPEIAVEQPVNTGLTDGISSVAVGNVNVSSSSASATFTIKNTGDVALTISSVAVTGGNASDFTVNSAGMLTSVPATTGSTTFTITFTPSSIGPRSTTLQVVSDDSDETTFDIALTGTGLNNAPTTSDTADQTIDEDTSTGTIAFSIGDVETAATALTATGSSSNTTLVPTANIVLGGSGANRTVTVTPAANQFGTSTITVTVSDGPNSVSDTFVLTVNPVNDAPTLSAISNPSAILEDAGMRTVNMSGISAGPGESQVLTVTSTSDNPGLIPNPMVTYTSPNLTGSLSYTPAANANGSAMITVTVDDGQASNNIATKTFTVTVTSVNDVPTINDITNQNINEDGNTGALAFTIGDVETATASIDVSGSSSNTALVPTSNIVFGGSGASRTVTVTPAANQSGTATITVTVSDGTASTSDTFLLTVNSVNDVPTISDIADQTINEDTNTGALSFTIGDLETAAASLTVTRSSSNTSLVPTANIVLGGSGANRTVTVTPAGNQSGTATITVNVSDGTASTSDTFLLTVHPVNDMPTISGITNKTINEDTSSGAIAFTIGDIETPAGSLALTASSSNVALVPDANVILGGSGASRNVSLTPLPNQFGTTVITITVSDGLLTTIGTFQVTVTSVNDLPTISDITNRAINEDASTGVIAFTIGDVDTDAASLTMTHASSNTVLVPTANIVLGGSGENRTVTVMPAANQFGTTTITVTVSDGTVTANDTFLLTVTSVNDVPTISNVTDRTINEDVSTGAIALTIGDVETAATSLTVTRASSNTVLVPTANIVLGGSGANRTVTVTPAANQFGISSITVTVGDGTATANDSFLLTVNAVNDAPTISDIVDQSIAVNSLTNSLPFTIGDVEMSAAALAVSSTSSNQVLVTDGNIFFGGSGASRTVTVIPESSQIGSTTITVTVSDGTLTGSDTFVVDVVAPEIAVEQPFNSNIIDGGAKSFGSVVVGADTSLNFFIKNIGAANLTGLTITQDGSDAAMFSVTSYPAAPLSGPNGNTAFTVRFAPTSIGIKTSAIHIASNDLDENPFDITITGNGVIPLADWRQQYFGSTTNSGDGADLNDYDDDGLPNLVEYAFGLNPKQNSAGELPQAQIVGGNFGFSFTEPDGVTGITYGAEWSATMAVEDWHAITDTGTAPQHNFSVPIGSNTGQFIRLKVTSP